eukprot:scaffold33047_cov61-Attheya_sp.AAC.2
MAAPRPTTCSAYPDAYPRVAPKESCDPSGTKSEANSTAAVDCCSLPVLDLACCNAASCAPSSRTCASLWASLLTKSSFSVRARAAAFPIVG